MEKQEIIFALCIVIGIPALVFSLALAISLPINNAMCHEQWANFKPSYTLFGGCMIEYNGQRIPASAYKVIDG